MTLRFLITTVAQNARTERPAPEEPAKPGPEPHPDTPEGAPR
jgi:hypothetical protein